MRFLFLLGIVVLNIGAFTAQRSANSNESNSIYSENSETKNLSAQIISHGAARFSGKLVENVAKSHRRNLVISPLGASLTLSMASFGAKKLTELVFRDALGLPLQSDHRKIGFQAVIDRLNSHKAVELHVANGVFVSSKIQPNPEFIKTTTKAFRSPVQKVDFSKSFGASNFINGWCENKTHSHIKSIINPDDLDESTGLVLVNAVYFKGGWLKKFDVDNTFDSTFTLEDGTTKRVLSMNAMHVLRYGEYPEVDATFVELPYQNDDGTNKMSMFIILPKDINGFAFLEANFHQISIQNLLKRGTKRRVNIRLPKFKIESEIHLEDPLTRMGLGNLFDPFKADFTGIVESPRLVLDKMVQKAFIEVNEEGSKAAAATAAIFGLRMNRGPRFIDFIVNRPFYAIIGTTDEIPLNVFTARFTG